CLGVDGTDRLSVSRDRAVVRAGTRHDDLPGGAGLQYAGGRAARPARSAGAGAAVEVSARARAGAAGLGAAGAPAVAGAAAGNWLSTHSRNTRTSSLSDRSEVTK